jgi:hypothetical protein
MIQFIVIVLIVGSFTAVFFGPAASIEVGEKLTNFLMGAGLAAFILSPFFFVGKSIYRVFCKILGIFHRKSAR